MALPQSGYPLFWEKKIRKVPRQLFGTWRVRFFPQLLFSKKHLGFFFPPSKKWNQLSWQEEKTLASLLYSQQLYTRHIVRDKIRAQGGHINCTQTHSKWRNFEKNSSASATQLLHTEASGHHFLERITIDGSR